MTLKEVYNKIDNFCCLNHNSLQGNTVKYLNGREEKINMFADYQETKDEDFCKDANEMIDCLDTISDLVDIEEKSGIDLLTLFKAQTEGIWYLQFQGYDENGNNVYMPVKQNHPLYIDFKQKALVGQWIGYDFKDYGKKKGDGWALTKEELLELLHISEDELLKLVHSIEEKDEDVSAEEELE